MDIIANIKSIEYKVFNDKQLKKISFDNFDINSMPTSCIIRNDKINFGISKWVSPKRTRSYPFERVYNTLTTQKRITIIPIIKDEGFGGDRDFIQWDTISLMSLLDIYVILSYYQEADIHKSRKNKITNQKFDNKYVKKKIIDISNFHSSALHWNLKEINNIPKLIIKVKKAYSIIANKLYVRFHNESGLSKFQSQFFEGVNEFMETSRKKAEEAQNREQRTMQPKEFLSTLSKATITIRNYLGGIYYFTTDEIKIDKNKLYLVECKHSKYSNLPGISDIKDGLLKMILYTNLENVKVNNRSYKTIPMLKLTSSKIKGRIDSRNKKENIIDFCLSNNFSENHIKLVNNIFKEARENKFIITIENAK